MTWRKYKIRMKWNVLHYFLGAQFKKIGWIDSIKDLVKGICARHMCQNRRLLV